MKTRKTMRKARLSKFLFLALVFSLVFAVPAASVFATQWMESDNLSKKGMFNIPYTSLADATADANKVYEEIVNEGTALVKNDGTLPLAPGTGSSQKKITVFNSRDVITAALTNIGYSVNALSTVTGSSTSSSLVTSLTSAQQTAVAQYNDAAVVRIKRDSGESNDFSTGASTSNTYGAITWVKWDGSDYVITAWNQADYTAGLLLEAWPDGTPKGWNHESLCPTQPLATYSASSALASRNVTPVRHQLMLTLDEEKMIQLAKDYFSTVIVVYESVGQFELWDLDKDPGINAIIVSGRMNSTQACGNAGASQTFAARGVARVMAGTVNPSAHLINQWDRDMTADPSWKNVTDNFHNDSTEAYQYSDGTPTGPHGRQSNGGPGLHGIDYEEGIYLGYKFYETYWNETAQGNTALSADAGVWSQDNQDIADQWHIDHVAYPFGFGLSYTDFTYNIVGVHAGSIGNKIAAGEVLDGSIFASDEGSPAEVKTLYVSVNVKNTGDVAGKAVVQIYASAPYIPGGVEKSFVHIVGFEKTRTLRPGVSQIVTVPVEVQDISSFDYDNRAHASATGGYILDEGEYVLRAMNSSSVLRSSSYDDFAFEIDNGGTAVALRLDDFSGNLAVPIFSTPNTMNYTIRDTNIMATGGTAMTILSRGNMDGTFPAAPTYKDLRLNDRYIDDYVRSGVSYVAGYSRTRASVGLSTAVVDYKPAPAGAWYANETNGWAVGADYEYKDDPSDPWYITRSYFDEVSAGWTQTPQSVRDADKTGQGADVKLRQMSGVPLYVYDNNGNDSINPLWDDFMNQLTYLELRIIVSQGNSQLARIDAIDKNRSAARDNTSTLGGTSYHWGDQPILSRTYNKELCADHGRMVAMQGAFSSNNSTGWWSPGANLQRSPFSGRNGDYYGQDALQAGLILAAVTKACEENGLACWIKHPTLNDQETNRNSNSLFVWADEQTLRENYFAYPQKGMQEGQSQGTMQSFGRIGGVVYAYSYAANIELYRHQWGWRGISVTDMLAGQSSGAYTVPTNPANWWDAGNGDGTYNTAKLLDKTKNWNGAKTAQCDQLVRGAQGIPDGNHAGNSTYSSSTGTYTNTINAISLSLGTGISTPASGTWGSKMEGGKGGVFLENEAGFNTSAIMDQAGVTMTTSGYHQWYSVRMTAMYCCYESANSRGNMNGMLVNDNTQQLRFYHSSTRTISGLKQGLAFSSDAAVIEDDLCGNTVAYKVTSGTLPAGLSLNAANGIISGTPLLATTANVSVTIECRVANYVYGNRTITIQPIAGALSYTGSAVGSAMVDTAFSGSVVADITGTKEYSIISGALPNGLALNFTTGAISGTPTTAGTFNFIVRVSVAGANYDLALAITVAANPTNHGFVIGGYYNALNEFIMVYQDGYESNMGTSGSGVVNGWIIGNTAPVINQGNNGDLFFNIATGDLYSKSAGNWTIVANLKGADGIDGTNGLTPQIGWNGNWWIGTIDTGVKAAGTNGTNGLTPEIGANGNWWIGTIDTGVKAAGTNGLTPEIGANGNWWIGTIDTGFKAAGTSGLTPFIGTNGNWWIGTIDTSVKAAGTNGTNGQDGKDGVSPNIGFNGNWWIGTTDTDVKAIGTNGTNGANGDNGLTPYIGTNGNWWVGTTDLGVKAQGPAGNDGDVGPMGPAGAKGSGCGSSSASIVALFSLLACAFVVVIKKQF